jgi:hypothetical protein
MFSNEMFLNLEITGLRVWEKMLNHLWQTVKSSEVTRDHSI